MKTINIFKLFIAVMVIFSFIAGKSFAGNKTVEISLPTIQCGMCERTIEKAINKIDGIVDINIDVENKKATVTYDDTKTDLTAIEKAMTSAGYDANDTKANAEAYKKLNNCCKLPKDR